MIDDQRLVEAMARAIADIADPLIPEWQWWVDEAKAALAAYRLATADDGK